MKFNFFNRAPAPKKGESAGKEEKRSNIESTEIIAGIIKKLAEFRDNIDELDAHNADDYVKNLGQLEKFPLSSEQAAEITKIHSEVMKKLNESGKLKEFTQGLTKRDRIKTLSSALEVFGRMQNKKI